MQFEQTEQAMSEEMMHILEKTALLYQKYGVRSVTMDDVASELGISKKTLYQHFADKHQLISMVTDHLINTRQHCMDEIYLKEMNAIEELFEVARFVNQMMMEHNPAFEYDLKKYYPEEYQKIRSIKRKSMYDSAYGNLQKGMEEGIYRGDMNPEIIARLHVARVEGMIDQELFSVEDISNRDVFKEIMVYHIRGIANQKGIRILESMLQTDPFFS